MFSAAEVVGLFEDTIARFTALAVLLPVVAGQSGNAGAQALAVTMRGLTLRETRAARWLRMVYKEANVGFFRARCRRPGACAMANSLTGRDLPFSATGGISSLLAPGGRVTRARAR